MPWSHLLLGQQPKGTVPSKQKGQSNIKIKQNIELKRNILPVTTPLDIGLLYDKLNMAVNSVTRIADEQREAMRDMVKRSEAVAETLKEALATAEKIAKINLEIEKTKLRFSEVTNLENNYNKNNSESNGVNTKNKNITDADTTEIRNNDCNLGDNNLARILFRGLEGDVSSTKLLINRDYKLTPKSSFDLWIDYLRSELISNDFLDVIDSQIDAPQNLNETKISKRKNFVRDIIINHIDENYHKRIRNLQDPKEILIKLKSYKKSESNVTHTFVRARLYQIKMGKDEKVNDFCERFDSIIREYELCDDAVPLTDQEKRSAFYQAVIFVVPDIRNIDLIKKQTNTKEMSIDEIKSFMFQLEAEKKQEPKEQTTIKRATFTGTKSTKEGRCHRCNKPGHWTNESTLKEKGLWFCYYCQQVTDHKGDEFIHTPGRSNQNDDKKRYNSKNKRNKFDKKRKDRVTPDSINYDKTKGQNRINNEKSKGLGRVSKRKNNKIQNNK